MATDQKQDYYDVLGVPRNAGADDLKKAFRRLAMQYHPDRNQEPGAEAKFKRVNEAYEVLSDPDKRAMYDRYGHAGVSTSAAGSPSFGRGFGGVGEGSRGIFGRILCPRRTTPPPVSPAAALCFTLAITREQAARRTPASRAARSSIDALRSAKRMVTCLRSPSSAAFDVRIRSARCFGV